MKKRYLRSVFNAALLVSLLLLVSCSKSKKEPNEHAAEQPEKKRIEVTEEALKKSGIQIEGAGPAVLKKKPQPKRRNNPHEERSGPVNAPLPGHGKMVSHEVSRVV